MSNLKINIEKYWGNARRQANELGHTYVACHARGARIHAAIGTTVGNGHAFPKPLCHSGSPSSLVFATPVDQHEAITCRRCLASIAKREAQS